MKEQLVTSTKQIYDGVNACTSITVHETDNTSLGADAQAHANLQTSGNVRQASWHIQVDDVEAIRSYPDEAQCWHAGTREGCETSIAVEICVNADGDYDKAFTRAANTVAELRQKHDLPRSAVVQHSHWTGKNCPRQMRLAGRWDEFTKLTDPQKEAAPMSTMINPVPGRVTSEWSPLRRNPATGVLQSHAGIDIAAPIGTLVVAAFAGRVISVRTGSYRGDPTHGYGPKTGNHVAIQNSDGAVQYFGHLNTTGCKVGQWIDQGEIIGTVGETGMVTGPHLHFECWSNNDINSNFNPRILFNRYGIKPGVGGGAGLQPAGSVTPIKKPAAKPKPKPSKLQHGYTRAQVNNIVRAMNRMGLNAGKPDGDYGPMLTAAVEAFQKHHGLVEDGIYGPKTQAVYLLNRKIQQALRDQGYTKQVVDGWIGDQTTANVKDFQRRTGLVQDGDPGSKTQKKLGL